MWGFLCLLCCDLYFWYGFLGRKAYCLVSFNYGMVENLDRVLLSTCKELIDDAKLGCIDMVFKDLCIEILAKAKLVLPDGQFEELSSYVSERLKEKLMSKPRHREKVHV